jgi:hypothetical protein
MKLNNVNMDNIQKEWLLRCIEQGKREINNQREHDKAKSLRALNISDVSEIDTVQMKDLTVEQIAYIDLDIQSKIVHKKFKK